MSSLLKTEKPSSQEDPVLIALRERLAEHQKKTKIMRPELFEKILTKISSRPWRVLLRSSTWLESRYDELLEGELVILRDRARLVVGTGQRLMNCPYIRLPLSAFSFSQEKSPEQLRLDLALYIWECLLRTMALSEKRDLHIDAQLYDIFKQKRPKEFSFLEGEQLDLIDGSLASFMPLGKSVDFRGRFSRAYGPSKGSAPQVCGLQNDTLRDHRHRTHRHNGMRKAGLNSSGPHALHLSWNITVPSALSGGSETRPRNCYVVSVWRIA